MARTLETPWRAAKRYGPRFVVNSGWTAWTARATSGATMADPGIDEILADARWLAHSYDRQRDEVHFVWLPREAHRAAAFLTRQEIAQSTSRRIVPRRLITGRSLAQAPLHLIFHSGLTGSTQLTHALDGEGVAMTLSEPPILTNIVSYRLAGASPQQTGAVLDDILSLLARPFAPGEAVIVKMGSIGNVLGSEILARRPSSRALCLHAPLPLYLASIARKGLEGRIWGRKLFGTLRSARLTEIGFTEDELFEHTDLQIAADAWLILHRIMGDAGARFGDRVRSTDSEAVIARPAATLAAIAGHFGLDLDAAAIVADPAFGRHSKTGAAFDAERRATELNEAATMHRAEIDLVVDWARKVAEVNRIAWTLPGQLPS